MLLTGTFTRSIDEKHRLVIPKRIRDQFATSSQPGVLYLAPGTDGSLAMYTEEAFSRLADKLSTASPTGQDVRAFSRLFYSQVQRVELDSQGRVRVPQELVDLAGLQKEAVLVGAGEHLELWDTHRWADYVSAKQDHYDDIAERAFAAGGKGDRNT